MILKLKDGDVKIELFEDKAPKHVERIKKLANAERYHFGKYKDTLERTCEKTFSNEGLVAGTAKINGKGFFSYKD